MRPVLIPLVVIVGLVAGCDRGDVIELEAWTLREGGHQRSVSLPGRLPLPDSEVRWSLTTEVVVPGAWSGQPVTLTVPFHFGPGLRVTVDGAEAVPIDDQAVASAFRLPASDQPRRTLVVEARHAHFLDASLPALPRLSATPRGDLRYRVIAGFERWSVVFALGLLAMITFVYVASWLLDRRREHKWLALQGSCAIYIVIVVYSMRAPAYPFVLHTLPLAIALTVVLGAAFHHAHFARGPLPRWIVALVPVAFVLMLATMLGPYQLVWIALGQVLVFVGAGYNLWLLARVARGRTQGHAAHVNDARVFLAAWLITVASAGLDNVPALGVQVVPVVSFPSGLAAFAFLQSFVLSRDRTRRTREAELLNVELRRQVADRSRELAGALSGSTGSNAPLAAGMMVEERYQVIRALGAGAMGAVYEVERLSDGRRCALKVITLRATGDILARFAREAQLAATLDAPNLVGVIDVGMSRTVGLFLVMELLHGGSLEKQRARFGDPTWARPLCAQIAAGLAAMHGADVLHRDLKPANVLLSDGEPPIAKIADFGLAAPNAHLPVDAAAATAAPQLTQLGAMLGTPAYMAPELSRGAEHASPASDVFALGVLAFELHTGKPPFAEPAVVLAHRGVTLPSVTGVPEAITRALAADPAHRPTAADLRDAMS